MFLSNRAKKGQSNILATLDLQVKQRQQQNLPVYNLSIGTPDLPPDEHVLAAAKEAADKVENYKYALTDSVSLIHAVQQWYHERFHVTLSEKQILSVYGTQEGMSHVFFTLCDPGDIVLLPSPLYPVFLTGVELACATPVFLPMLPENNYLIDFDAIDPAVAEKAKVIVVSYPNNPTTVTAPPEFYEKLVSFAKKYNIFVIHDNAYGELVLDGPQSGSFLAVPGAMDIGMEFNSLSKTYNLTGARLSFALGNEQVIDSFRSFRSQIDYGLFPVASAAAVAALTGPQDIVERNRNCYRSRRDVLTQGLREIGWNVPNCHSTMFTWYPIPENFGDDDIRFTTELLHQSGVVGVPGSSFGKEGKGFIRFALTMPEEQLKKAIQAIAASGILNK